MAENTPITPGTDYAEQPREVYPNAQLQLVAVELRYPFAPRLGSEEALSFFVSRVKDLPVAEPIQEQTFVFRNEGVPDIKGSFAFRLTTRDRATAATISPTKLALETTNYERYGMFRRLLKHLLEALDDYGRPAGVERLGLRYIDEIKVPDVTAPSPDAWKPYIDHALVTPAEVVDEVLPNMRPRSWNGVLHLQSSNGTTLVVRYGALDGHAVNPDGPLRLTRRTEPGPFFLLDIDSFWHAEEVIADFDLSEVLATCDQLHRPISAVFERCITDRLRDEVLRKERIGAERGGQPPDRQR